MSCLLFVVAVVALATGCGTSTSTRNSAGHDPAYRAASGARRRFRSGQSRRSDIRRDLDLAISRDDRTSKAATSASSSPTETSASPARCARRRTQEDQWACDEHRRREKRRERSADRRVGGDVYPRTKRSRSREKARRKISGRRTRTFVKHRTKTDRGHRSIRRRPETNHGSIATDNTTTEEHES